MALIHEDGTGLADAESYASVSYADAYFVARGNAPWSALSVEAREQALRLATDYLEAAFGPLWRSQRLTVTQALTWPRVGWAGVPEPVQRACCELAFRASAGPLVVDEGPQVREETVGPISVAYAPGARQNVRYSYVWAMLGPYLSAHMIVERA